VGVRAGRGIGTVGVDPSARATRKAGYVDGLAASPFRVDRDRIVASPFFARLGGVTQVVSSAGSGLLVHNRLTHSLKVAQVARAIAERLLADPDAAALIDALGGCDPDVAEAAALAHDLGHPPFGHLGEQVLDRIARNRLGLPDGFEGNAQSYRIVTSTEIRGTARIGLDLTAAVRAAMLKYPWTRSTYPMPHPRHLEPAPRGATASAEDPTAGSAKFGAYTT
jgi:dGTPase